MHKGEGVGYDKNTKYKETERTDNRQRDSGSERRHESVECAQTNLIAVQIRRRRIRSDPVQCAERKEGQSMVTVGSQTSFILSFNDKAWSICLNK